jgi:hypothetical protein
MNLSRKFDRTCRPLLAVAVCVASAWAAAQGDAPDSHAPGSVDCGTVASAGSTDALCSGALSSGTSAASGALLVPEGRRVGPATPAQDASTVGAPNGGNNDGGANLPGNNSTGNNTTRGADRTNENTRAGD